MLNKYVYNFWHDIHSVNFTIHQRTSQPTNEPVNNIFHYISKRCNQEGRKKERKKERCNKAKQNKTTENEKKTKYFSSPAIVCFVCINNKIINNTKYKNVCCV